MNGKQVLRPAKGDELDKFLDTVENPESWCVIRCCMHKKPSYTPLFQDVRL